MSALGLLLARKLRRVWWRLRGDRGPVIFRTLDLSTAHLPPDVRVALSSYAGVIATEREYGWLLWVPDYVDEYLADYAEEDVPESVVGIWRFAVARDCAYVLLDADAAVAEGLPFWQR